MGELLVCDDGSTDASGEWLKSVHDVIAAEKNVDKDGGVTNTIEISKKGIASDDPAAILGNAARSDMPAENREFVNVESWPGEDAPPPTAKEVAERFILNGHDLRILASHGRGQGAAQNLCLEMSTADLVSLHDADDRATPDRFAKLYAALEKHRSDGWDAVCSGVRIFGQVSSGMARYVDWQNSLLSPEDIRGNRFVEIPGIHQTTLFHKGLLLERLKGYRDQATWPIDMDTWCRLGERGIRIGKIEDKLYGWRQHALQSTRSHGKCSLDSIRNCKAHYLLRLLPADIKIIEMWSVGATLDAWAKALFTAARSKTLGATADPLRESTVIDEDRSFRIRLVEWRFGKRRRGGHNGGQNDSNKQPDSDDLLSSVERVYMEAGSSPPCHPEDGESVARIFAYGSADVRWKAEQAISAATNTRWLRLDWPAA